MSAAFLTSHLRHSPEIPLCVVADSCTRQRTAWLTQLCSMHKNRSKPLNIQFLQVHRMYQIARHCLDSPIYTGSNHLCYERICFADHVSSAVPHIHLKVSSAGCEARSLCTDKGSIPAAAVFTEQSSNDCAIGDNAVLDDNHNSILDDKTQVLLVGLLDVALVGNANVATNPSVLVNNSLAHNGVGTCKQWQRVGKGTCARLWSMTSPPPQLDLTCIHWQHIHLHKRVLLTLGSRYCCFLTVDSVSTQGCMKSQSQIRQHYML